MAENSPRGRSYAGAVSLLAILAVVALILAILWLQPSPKPAPPPPAPPEPVAKPVAVKAPPPPLDRTDLIRAAETLASDAAPPAATAPAGRDPLIDRAFRLRIPFGCDGPQIGAGTSQAYYEVDAQRRTVKLLASPADLANHPLVTQGPGAGEIEALETFWIPRPWSRSDACPPRRERPAPATPTPPSPPTLGLGAIFETETSRLGRRGARPYELVRKVPAGADLPLKGAYALVLEGRLAAFPSGTALRCWTESPDHRPVCVYAVVLDRVAFETASGEPLAEWSE